ncbi:Peptidase-M75 domain-containing protein [Sulfidibacter corallicola]|uniref:Imelysin-like domain-containing protein n=1 Tax=Sulfidibacter corallicola TaxID=2818388 RepID=A0A8A4TPB5_SULCO|nr:imelysin family protein [Sulfidibacter corallicola]QTD50808.1 hypothetical protein J3U87_34930 [Sulfidibacter corallicola]
MTFSLYADASRRARLTAHAALFVRLVLVVLLGFTLACSDSDDDDNSNPTPTTPNLDNLKADIAENYATLVHTSYLDSLQLASAMQTTIVAFVNNPNAETHAAAKEAWLAARVPYGQTESYRFYDGPIDDANGPEGALNAWPLDENYIDYVTGFPDTGIVNDPVNFPELTKELLRDLNEKDGEANISTGFHAIEFLLWGQDGFVDGPGQRSHVDFVLEDAAASNQDRRGQYLLLVTEMLIEDLQFLVGAWAPDQSGNYRETFVADGDEALRSMLLGIGSLSGAELAGERMAVALDTREQEDEHSCFSDNTHIDIIMNALGIKNVYLGRFETTSGVVHDGPGLDELMSFVDDTLNQEMLAQLDTVETACAAIPVPFDQAIRTESGRPIVQVAVDELRAQTTLIVSIAEALDITLNLEE